jgi:D-sedoheptulose 7-phosphate isomerase
MHNGADPRLTTASGYLIEFARLLQQVSATDQQQTPIHIDVASERVVEHLIAARLCGNKVMLIGNGGSAAIVSHFHNDLTKAAGVRALVFNEQPLLMALANDEGYASVFERPLDVWAVSSSGVSENIVRAARSALRHDMTLITLSGFEPSNPLRQSGHLNFYVPSHHYGMVEQTHSVLTHHFSDAARLSASADNGRDRIDGRELLAT